MAIYKFYAVVEKETLDSSGSYIVSFPDLENVFTDGETFEEAQVNAKDVLETMLVEMELDGDSIPKPTSKKRLTLRGKVPKGASLILVEVDTSNELITL